MNRKGTMQLIKQMNQNLVLDAIRARQPISRAALARLLGMSRATISAIVDELLRIKFIEERGRGLPSKAGGKPTVELGFNAKSGFGIGVDVGGTKIYICISDLDGNPIYERKVKTSPDVGDIRDRIREAIAEAGIEAAAIAAVGFGVPGTTDSDSGVVIDAPSLHWANKPFVREMQPFFDAPVFVTNDVNAAALGERWTGSARQTDDLLFVAIGTGVGAAVVAGGQLLQGHAHMAGEIGYWIDAKDWEEGRRNAVGEFGVFEGKTSGTGLNRSGFASEALFQACLNGNARAVAAVDAFLLQLSVGIANAVSLLNPEKVVLGGGVARSLPPFLDRIRATVDELTPIKTEIALSSLGEKSGAVGAIAYAFRRLREL